MTEILAQTLLLADSTIRLATPLMFCALAGLFSERSGVVNIALEGKMLAGAFAAAATAQLTGSALAGLFAAIGSAILLALLHGFATVTHRGDQVVSGMAINITVAGLCPTLANAWFGEAGRILVPAEGARFLPVTLPFAGSIGTVPVVGPLYAELVSGHNILVYAAFLALPTVGFVISHTRFGLRLRAVGEHPEAVDTAGISVQGMRYRALLIAGLLAGLAGAYVSIAQNAGFSRDVTAGKGYLAVAALIIGKWRPVPAFYACLLIAFADALQARLQGVRMPVIGQVPTEAVQALPYLLAILLLAGSVGQARAPKAIGQSYVKER